MKPIKLLLIEDEFQLSYMIKSGLEDMIGGYEVDCVSNGEEGLERLKSSLPDVIVSDIMMPVLNGLDMVKKIRQTGSNLPVIFATAKNAPKDVVMGYAAGANNYIKKPFTPEELDAHIEAALNRKNNNTQQQKNAIHKIGNYTFIPKNFSLFYKDTDKKVLTATESHILELLLQHKGEIVKRETILELFWEKGDTKYTSRSLDVFISKLRNYLSNDISVSIKNVKSAGLILDFDELP